MLTFETAQEHQVDEIAAFLSQRFGVSSGHRPFRPDVLHWKCFRPHPLWNGSRSYVYRRDGQIVAHGCVMPGRWLLAAGSVHTACIIDWAADPAVPGAGILLYRGIGKQLDGLMGIGGSEDARRTLLRAGYHQIHSIHVLRSVIRPAGHHLQGDRQKDWKTPVRLARDVLRMTQQSAQVPPGWSAERMAHCDASIEPSFPALGRPSPAVAQRSVDLLNYYLECPAAEMQAYRVRGPGSSMGYFLLSTVANESRICDFGINTSEPGDWRALAALAITAAREDSNITQIRLATSSKVVREAFEGAGFLSESIQPLVYWDRAKKGIEPQEISMTFVENDFFYL